MKPLCAQRRLVCFIFFLCLGSSGMPWYLRRPSFALVPGEVFCESISVFAHGEDSMDPAEGPFVRKLHSLTKVAKKVLDKRVGETPINTIR